MGKGGNWSEFTLNVAARKPPSRWPRPIALLGVFWPNPIYFQQIPSEYPVRQISEMELNFSMIINLHNHSNLPSDLMHIHEHFKKNNICKQKTVIIKYFTTEQIKILNNNSILIENQFIYWMRSIYSSNLQEIYKYFTNTKTLVVFFPLTTNNIQIMKRFLPNIDLEFSSVQRVREIVVEL